MSDAALPVLLIGNERQALSTLQTYLEQAGLHVLVAADLETGLLLAQHAQPALIVVDPAYLSTRDPSVAQELLPPPLETVKHTFVLWLTASAAQGAYAGTNQKIGSRSTAHQSPDAVLAQLQSLQRHLQDSPSPASTPLIAGDLQIDPAYGTVKLDGKHVRLTAVEFALLLIFFHNPGRPLTRTELLQLLQATTVVQDDTSVRTVDAHIKNLRSKLASTGRNVRFIETVHGVGYRFVA